ncbi:TerD family protein [Limnospira fusiformis]|uniref:TerD family protein n=1 Tax=Limnospira fusiformis TaxID=54297 RepID=UPI0034E0773B
MERTRASQQTLHTTKKISMLMGELYRDNGKWKFTALGTPLNQDLSGVVKKFM